MSDRTVTFSELAEEKLLEIGAGRPRSAGLDRYPLPILRVADVLDGRIESSFKGHARDTYRQAVGPKISKPGDIVLTTKGTIGRVALMPAEGPNFAYSPQLCYFRPITDGALKPRYLYYWFKSKEFWDQADALKGQTDMADFLSLSDIHALKMRLPSLEEQTGVVDVLGALDDKIAVNDRIALTAQELTAALLSKMLMKDIDATDIVLGDIADINKGKVAPRPGRCLRYIDISSVSVDRIEWPRRIPWEEAPSRARRGVAPGDTIWSTVRPGRRSRALILDDDPELVVSTGLAVLTPRDVPPAYLYEVTRRDQFVEYLESVAEGSAYPAVQAERFRGAPLPLLSPTYLENFEAKAIELQRRAHAAKRESRTLAELRDTLLPKLMSGEIRVRDAEKAVEEAT